MTITHRRSTHDHVIVDVFLFKTFQPTSGHHGGIRGSGGHTSPGGWLAAADTRKRGSTAFSGLLWAMPDADQPDFVARPNRLCVDEAQPDRFGARYEWNLIDVDDLQFVVAVMPPHRWTARPVSATHSSMRHPRA